MDKPGPVVEVFADIGCPFTHVGLRRLVDRRNAMKRDDVSLWVRAWPLEVVNGKPLDPAFIAEEVTELRQQATPELFDKFDAAVFPASSLPALALAAAAYRTDPSVGEAVSLELRDLLFERGVAVDDSAVLAEIAARWNIDVTQDDHDSIAADHAEGARRGVVGSPYFVTPSGSFFCPALDISRDANGHLRISADPAGFDQFVESCFSRPT